MKRSIILMVVLASVAACATASAGVEWEGDFHTFRYGVDTNGGNFIYSAGMYWNSSSAPSVLYHNPLQGATAPYNGTALGELFEFSSSMIPGEILVRGMAKGPDGGISPPKGLLVQGLAEIVPSDLNADHGVDIEQKVVCWITRRFLVDGTGLYTIEADLAGAVNFTSFNYANTFQGGYSVVGTIVLSETLDDWLNVSTLLSFPLDESTREDAYEVTLRSEAKYELRVVLKIDTHLVNFNYQSGQVAGALPAGSYRVGETGDPMVLNATVYDSKDLEPGLPEAIIILQILAGMEPAVGDLPRDLSGDGKLGLEEVIYGLQKAAELR